MSAVEAAVTATEPQERAVVVRKWGAPIAYAVFAIAAWVMFVVYGRDGVSTMALSNDRDRFQLPDIDVPSRGAGLAVAIALTLAAVAAFAATMRAFRVPVWAHSVYGFLFVFGFLAWASAGALLPVTGLLMVAAAPIQIPTLYFGRFAIPHPIGPDKATYELMRSLHGLVFDSLVVLGLIHLGAALVHQFVWRDRLLRRMWFGRAGSGLP